jgi:uncharacterized membrane protein
VILWRHMNLKIGIALLSVGVALVAVLTSTPVTAVGPDYNYFWKARVVELIETKNQIDEAGEEQLYQRVKVELLDGDKRGSIVELEHGGSFALRPEQLLEVGDKIIVGLTEGQEGVYYLKDFYRVPSLAIIMGLFILLAVAFAGWRGVGSLLGLAVSGVVVVTFIVPRLAAGQDPILISLIGSAIIVCVSLYLAHGFNRRASVALISTLITLGMAVGLSVMFVTFAKLFGLGGEEALTLQLANNDVNFQGLLLGGILLGTLGVLDDVTAAQAAVVEEIRRANPRLSVSELYWRSLSVGREHIAALVNTLALAYAGISLPLFLLFTFYGNEPLWVVINSEYVAEEIIRTLVGSSSIVLAVPITTLLAVYVFSRWAKVAEKQNSR